MNKNAFPTRKLPSLWLNAILALLLTLSLLMSLLTVAFLKVIYSPNVVEQTFQSQGAILKIPKLAADTVINARKNLQNLPISTNLNRLTPEGLQTIFAMVFSEEWAKKAIQDLIKQEIVLLTSRNPSNQITLDIADIKNQFEGPGSLSLIQTILSQMPACSTSEVDALLNPSSAAATGFPLLCKPAEFQSVGVAANIQKVIPTILSLIPNEVVLLSSKTINDAQTLFLGFIRRLRNLRMLLILAPIFTLVVIVVIMIYNRRFLGEGLKLIGDTILIISSGFFLGDGLILIISNAYFTPTTLSARTGLSSALSADLFPVVLQVGDAFLFYVGLTAFVGFVIGLVLILLARVLERKPPSLT